MSNLETFTRRIKYIARFGCAPGQVQTFTSPKGKPRINVGINGFLFSGSIDGDIVNIDSWRNGPSGSSGKAAFTLDLSNPRKAAEIVATEAWNPIP